MPGVAVIQPNRAGSYPFCKVTFVSSGEKRDFFLKNKSAVNKYTTSTLVPQSIDPREREIKENLKKEICTLLSNKGFRIQDKDLTFYLMCGYIPNFHLKYRVFLNNLPSHNGPQERAPSFTVSSTGFSLWRIKSRMG